MITCSICGGAKERRYFSGKSKNGDMVCTACLIAVKVEPVKPKAKPAPNTGHFCRQVRVRFRGESLTFRSIAAAARRVGVSETTIRRIADGRVATTEQLQGLEVKYLRVSR